jgi:DNA invertase Pin-like site-specific DNA recombinase
MFIHVTGDQEDSQMRLAAYVRVSTKGQADDGLGRVDQERRIRTWTKRNGHTICGQVAFDQASGTTPVDQRPGFVEVMGRIRDGQCEGLVVLNLGRVARLLTVQEAALAMVWSTGGRVFTVDAGEVLQDDPDDPMRTAIRQMMAAFHQLDRAMIVARLQGGRQVKAAQGGYAYGAPAFGQAALDKALVADEAERATIRRILELERGGLSLRQMAAVLEAEGRPAKRGGKWHPQTIARVLERASSTPTS